MPDNWQAVGQAITQRREELRLKQRDVAKRSGVSQAIIRELEYNTVERRRSHRTLEALSTALEWPAGHLTAIRATSPTSTSPTAAPPIPSPQPTADPNAPFHPTGTQASMTRTRIGEAITNLANALDTHLTTYSLPTPTRVELSVQAKPSDHITLTLESDNFSITAATMLHWANTLLTPQARLTGETTNHAAEVRLHGRLKGQINIIVTAHPTSCADELDNRTLPHEQTVVWLHIQATGALR
ncbi:DNA-binding XRE family transcriptional regulator [Actinokineospora baliensis]|uniref:helix-turn-helix domain-containing protein n=1 Tax=Actinokineospora baliensis TaxID=547056 RepID=UPI00195C9A54|nr:helix-turn-helix transcriptional regulator [Actinokineospora baliensis]MBM7770768.1 DNA-binding XRE family transcriptional regulator [Actinokineospora baliensis]